MPRLPRTSCAKNVVWIWCPNAGSVPAEAWNDPLSAYPGNEYVDWVAISGFNFGTVRSYSKWQSFSDIYADPIRYLRTLGKPICVAEFGSVEKGGDKAAWIRDAYARTAGPTRLSMVAASFAVSGEAWAIKTIVEHRERKFLALRNEFRQKEEDLRRQIIALAEQLSAECLSLGEVLIPFEYFERILAAVDVRCRATRCPFSLTRCRLEQIESEIKIWGRGRLTPGSLELYAVIFSSALRDSTALYWALWGYEMPDARYVYTELRRALDRALASRPSIRTVSGDRQWRDRRDAAPPAGHGRPRRKRRRASRNHLVTSTRS